MEEKWVKTILEKVLKILNYQCNNKEKKDKI